MRAGDENVVKELTGSDYDPIWTFHFSSALPGIPSLAYGIKKYRGKDTLMEEMYEIKRLDLTASTFKVQVDIIGYTSLYIFNVPYIAVDPNFPHHLNSFDNVPISYGSKLVNFTSKKVAPTYYKNYINYTEQASSKPIKTFAAPLESNKIMLFITSLHIFSSYPSPTNKPVNLKVSYKIENSSTYSMSAVLST